MQFNFWIFVFFAGSGIPDANLIHAIRKRRQLAREQGDFIALDDTVRATEDKSRLVR